MKDYYKILEIRFEATDDEIKRAYRHLAQKYHPDKHFGIKSFEEKFKEINEAYSILSDVTKRSSYNTNFKNYFFKQSAGHTKGGNTSSNYENQNTNTSDKTENQKDTPKEENANATKMNNEKNETNLLNKNFPKAIVLVLIIGISILVYKWNDISTYYDEKDKKDKYAKLVKNIQETKSFRDLTITSLRIPRVSLSTRWKDDFMYYKFYLFSKNSNEENSYRKLRSDSSNNDLYFETRVKTINKINLNFLDKDGFKIYSFDVTYLDMTRILDASGYTVGYTINSKIQLAPELYNEFKSWEITYTTN